MISNDFTWGTPVVSADTTLGGLQVDVVGKAGTLIQWTLFVETTETIY